MISPQHYDIILVFVYSRIHNYFLNIVKYMCPEVKIGIFVTGVEKAKFTDETNQLFLALCEEMGADVFYEGKLSCKLLVVPQFRETGFLWNKIKNCITFKSVISAQSFGSGDEYLSEYVKMGVHKHLVYDENVFQNKLKNEESKKFVKENLEIIEMGSPDLKYPVFPDFKCDYMIAFPTKLSFIDHRARTKFLENLISVLSKIPQGDKIVIKVHNVKDGGFIFDSSKSFNFHKLLNLNPDGKSFKATSRLAQLLTFIPYHHFIRLYNGFLYYDVTRRGTSMDDLTPYYNLGIELFLPGVKKGLITGRTSSVWYALYNKIPVFNCDNETEKALGQNVLDSYKSFGVPPCSGDLRFDTENINKISNSARKADLIEILKKELNI